MTVPAACGVRRVLLRRTPSASRHGIDGTRFREPLRAQTAAVAPAARTPLRRRIVAARREAVVEAERQAAADDLRLAELEQGREDLERPSLDARACRQRGDALDRLQVFRPAVGIPRIIER